MTRAVATPTTSAPETPASTTSTTVSAADPTGSPLTTGSRIHVRGVGPVHAGMTLRQAEQAAGVPLVIESFEQLMEATRPDFAPIYARLGAMDSVPAGSVLPTDAVFNRGTGEGWLTDGDV